MFRTKLGGGHGRNFVENHRFKQTWVAPKKEIQRWKLHLVDDIAGDSATNSIAFYFRKTKKRKQEQRFGPHSGAFMVAISLGI